MQYVILINQLKALEWGLDLRLSALFAFLYQVPSWADQIRLENQIWFHISKSKLADELPILTDKPDTIYRQMRGLADKGLIEMTSSGPRTLFRLTEEGKKWNRKVGKQSEVSGHKRKSKKVGRKSEVTPDANPSYPGSESEVTSEHNPTYIGTESELTSDSVPTDHITRSSNQSETTSSTASARSERFAMHEHWQPSTNMPARIRMSGIPVDAMTQEIFGEFVSHWLSQPAREHTQSEWEHRLLKSLISTHRRTSNANRNPDGSTGSETGSNRDDVRKALSDVGDRSWAEGLS